MATMFQTLHRSMKPTDRLKMECGACHHRADLGRAQAVERFGPDAAPYDIRRRAVCAACGARRRAAVWI